jgi:hypothetical protein
MRVIPSEFKDPLKYEEIKISETAKKQLTALSYEKWLKNQNATGSFKHDVAKYDPSTAKEFLTFYREEKQKEWNIAKLGTAKEVSEFRSQKGGFEVSDGNNLAKYNILSTFENYTDNDIRKLSTENLNSFIDRVYKDKNRDFNDVNRIISFQGANYDTHSHTQTKSNWSISNFFKKLLGNSEKEPLKNIGPLNKAPEISRTKSMPTSFNYKSPTHEEQSFGNPHKRKRSAQPDLNSTQENNKRTKSENSSYFQAFIGGNPNKLKEVEAQRYKDYKQEEERREAEKRRKEEAQKKVQKPQSPKRASSLHSPSANPHNLFFDKDGRLRSSSPQQISPFTRNSPVLPSPEKPPLRGPSNSRPSSRPGQPLSATQTNKNRGGPTSRRP